jgi:formate dehydrogenase major subunit
MTNHWIDMIHADVVMICGSNAAENHPIAMKWIRRAKENGAIILSVDPRYTRTSSLSDVYAPLRSGTDIAFVGGMINYALQNGYVNREFLLAHTNAPFLIKDTYGFMDGLFSGYDPQKRAYDKSVWAYQLDAAGEPRRDDTLTDPHCVYQLMVRHFSRYTVEQVCQITGTPTEAFFKICENFTSTCAPDRSATWLYAMGTTQHTHGTQNIRSYVILQLLMGNMGIAGGGINALRGESNVQGSTDHGLLFHLLPGYLKAPDVSDQTLPDYLVKNTPKAISPQAANWWGNYPKYAVSLLKAWYGDAATAENGYCFDYLPKKTGNRSHIPLFETMLSGGIEGLFLFGQNPAVGGPNALLEREALGKLKWMVAVDLFETDTAAFWKRDGISPGDIQTEVFLLPAASSVEKEGSVSNSGRWVQWRYRAVDPLGDARSDLWVVHQLVKHLQAACAGSGAFPEPLTRLRWEYPEDAHGEPDVHTVAREINGYFLADADFPDRGKSFKKDQQVPSFVFLRDDGTTACGNWIICGSYTDAGNMMARRDPVDAPNGLKMFPNWSWCWPVNRRILYNRASCDRAGRPYNPKKWVIRWNAASKAWEGDVPDGPWPPEEKTAFIMRPDGVASLFAFGLEDGPFPEHYEPVESPVPNLMSSQPYNPAIKIFRPEQIGTPAQFPIVGTTYRVSEHWQAGAMTRNIPWLVELVPSVFAEISVELARQKGITNGDRIRIVTKRGAMEAHALVTQRFKPFYVADRWVHQMGIIWHFGYQGLATGDSANILTPHVGDANTTIPEFKAFLCDIERVAGRTS